MQYDYVMGSCFVSLLELIVANTVQITRRNALSKVHPLASVTEHSGVTRSSGVEAVGIPCSMCSVIVLCG